MIESLETLVRLILENGLRTVLIAAASGIIIWRHKEIINWALNTIQASAIVAAHEETIKELKASIIEMRSEYEVQIKNLRDEISKQNEVITEQTATIAKLEERMRAAQDIATRTYSRSIKPSGTKG